MIVSSTDPTHMMPFPYNAEKSVIFTDKKIKPIIKDPMGAVEDAQGCQPLKPQKCEVVIINRKDSENGQKLNILA